MHQGSIELSRIVAAFERNVPGCYVRDYRPGGWITICRGYMAIYSRWHDTEKLFALLPAETLCSLPESFVQAPDIFSGLRLVRPGWRRAMRKAGAMITAQQKHRIERELSAEVF